MKTAWCSSRTKWTDMNAKFIFSFWFYLVLYSGLGNGMIQMDIVLIGINHNLCDSLPLNYVVFLSADLFF